LFLQFTSWAAFHANCGQALSESSWPLQVCSMALNKNVKMLFGPDKLNPEPIHMGDNPWDKIY